MLSGLLADVSRIESAINQNEVGQVSAQPFCLACLSMPMSQHAAVSPSVAYLSWSLQNAHWRSVGNYTQTGVPRAWMYPHGRLG